MVIESKYAIGDKLRDKVTGAVGIVMVIAKYQTGCLHYGIQQAMREDGKIPEWLWLDESRFEFIEETEFTVKEDPSSGPEPKGPQL